MAARWSAGVRTFLVVTLALALGSCDQATPTAPTEPAVTPQAAAAPLRLVTETSVSIKTVSVSSLIGVLGGKLRLQGHTLTVPPGAVTSPTVFTLLAYPNSPINVGLTAIRVTPLGTIDVGEAGFEKPVTLALSYRRRNGNQNPTGFVIVHIDGTSLIPLPSTVNQSSRIVHAKLSHFSKYGLASN